MEEPTRDDYRIARVIVGLMALGLIGSFVWWPFTALGVLGSILWMGWASPEP